MKLFQLLTIAFIATGHMTIFYWLIYRFGIAKSRFRPTIRSFTIPEESHASWQAGLLHLIAGIFFTWAYVYLLLTPSNLTLGRLVSLGTLFGFVHGIFLIFFVLLGFSGLRQPGSFSVGTFQAMILTLFSHILFGAAVGLGVSAYLISSTWNAFIFGGVFSLSLWWMIGHFIPPLFRHKRRVLKIPSNTQPAHKHE